MLNNCLYCFKEIHSVSARHIYCSRSCSELGLRAKKYGMSFSDFRQLRSKDRCDICTVYLTPKSRCIDHRHEDGKVRGVLCRQCNTALGLFKDNQEILTRARTYLDTDSIPKSIVDMMTHLYQRGWITTRDGNISVRDGDKLYITKTAVKKSRLSLDDILIIPIVANAPLYKDSKVSIEFLMHWLLLKDKSKGAVIHAHPTNIVAAMDLASSLNNISKGFPEISRYTRVGKDVPFEPPGNHALAQKTAHNIANNDIVGLKKHGVTSTADTLDGAFEHIERLEHICQIVLASGVTPNE